MHWEVWPDVALFYGAPAVGIGWFVFLAVYDRVTGRHFGD